MFRFIARCAVLSLAFATIGCEFFSKLNDSPAPSDALTVSFTDFYDNQSSADQFAADDLSRASMTGYWVENGAVKAIFTDIMSSIIARQYAIRSANESELFMVCNALSCKKLAQIKVGSSKDELLGVTLDEDINLQPRSLALSGVVRLTPAQTQATVALSHVGSRVDVKLAGVKVSKVRVNGVQRSSYLFATPEKQYSATATSYDREFTSALTTDLRALTYLFEQSGADLSFTFDCSLTGSSKQQQVEVKIPYDKIERNKIYLVTLSSENLTPDDPDKPDPKPDPDPDEPVIPDPEPENKTIVGKFEILPWNDEDIDVGYPDLNAGVDIDMKKFEFDAKNVDFDAAQRKINVSYRGTELKIPFFGAFDKVVTLVGANSNVTLTPTTGTRYANDEVTVSVVQPINSRGYSFTINVKNAFAPLGKGVNYVVTVDQSSPASVVMGGVEWMSFNAGSGKEYPILDLNEGPERIREIYKQSWGDYVNMCQWGKRAKALPNTFLPPSISMRYVEGKYSDGTLEVADRWIEKTPCPAGWRLPKMAEVLKFFPANGTNIINGSVFKYTVDGVNYTAQVITTGGADYTTQPATSPGSEKKTSYAPKILVISDGKNEIIFPLSGYRRQDSVQNGDGDYCDIAYKISTAFFIWCDWQNGSRGDSGQIAGINRYGSISVDLFDFGNMLKGSWNTVRCVRNL